MYNVTPVQSKPVTRRPRLSAQMSGLLLAALVLTFFQLALVYLHIPDYNTQPKNDFNLFLKFGRYVLDGQTPYQGELPFIYQLWVSFLYLPFVPLEHDLALHSWAIFNLALLAGAVWLLWRTFLPDLAGWWLLPLYCLALAVCSNAIMTGHTTVFSLLALSLSLYSLRRQRYFLAGVPVFVLLIKPQLTFLAGLAMLILLFYRSKSGQSASPIRTRLPNPLVGRWLAGAVAGTLAILAISLLVQPDWPLRYAHTFNVAQTQGELQPDGTYLEYYKSIFPSWLEFLFGLTQPWLAIVSVLGMGSLLVWGGWRLVQWRDQPVEFLAIGLALNLAVTPYSHIYDFPPVMLAVFVLLARIRQDWQAGQLRLATGRGGLLALLFALQPLSADYRWFYSQVLGIALLVFSFGPPKLPFTTGNENENENERISHQP